MDICAILGVNPEEMKMVGFIFSERVHEVYPDLATLQKGKEEEDKVNAIKVALIEAGKIVRHDETALDEAQVREMFAAACEALGLLSHAA